jgi:transposase InsO family protein
VAEVCGRPSGEFHHHAVPLLELPKARRDRGKKALLLIWDNASWHTRSKEVRSWIEEHNTEQSKTAVAKLECE